MHRSQLIQILHTLSKKEIRDLKKWLRSPFHNQREDVIDLFDYCFTRDYLEREEKLVKEVVFEKIFPNEEYDDAKIRQTIYFFTKSLEAFLIYNELSKDDTYNDILLAKTYKERKLFKYVDRTLNSIERKFEKPIPIGGKYYWNKYLFEYEKYSVYTETKPISEKIAQLQSTVNSLDHFFMVEQLRNVCSLLLNTEKAYSKDVAPLLEEISNIVDEGVHQDSPMLMIYYSLFKVLKTKDDEQFFLLKKHLLFFINRFSFKEKKDMILIVLNYCINKMNRGDKKYIREAFELNKLGLKEDIFINNELLDPYTFRNITSIALHLKEFDWTEKFINKYSNFLHKKYKNSFSNFGLGSLYFMTKDYKKSMQHLAMYEHDDIMLNLNSKSMLLRMYYELDELNALESLLESFKAYLKRKKGISETYVLVYGNLIKYTKKLVRVNPYDKQKKEKLHKEILDAKPMINKEWFLEQLQAMK